MPRSNPVPAQVALSLGLVLAACSGGTAAPPPPPQGTQPQGTQQGQQQQQQGTAQQGTPTPTLPPGHVMVTVAASSTPVGAVVTGGGQMLGRTPFTTQVPTPAPAPGRVQTFQFTFELPGYQPATVSASPINNTITLNLSLAPMGATPTGTVEPAAGGASGAEFVVRGGAGGAIFDMHTTTSTARVEQSCVISELHVDIDGTHTFSRDLVVSLRGPDGQGYQLQNHTVRNPFRNHPVRRAAGHPSAGTWTLAIADTVGADSGTLRGWSLRIRCRLD